MKDVLTEVGKLSIHKNAFAPLVNLEFLYIMCNSKASASATSDITLPSTLRNLTIADCDIESIDVNHLAYLEDFNASDNKLKEFPNFDHYATLVSIDVRNNPITNITTEHISFYCFLKYFGLSYINSPKEATDEYQYCTCANLLNWMDLYNIFPGSSSMNCTSFIKGMYSYVPVEYL